MDKITPFLWFDDQAEEAASFYVSIFNDSKIVSVMKAMMKMSKIDIAALERAAEGR
jgi:predicted 3-demethylubiquinone-9 3-methyltransferase (glyoxalase superfamily)